MMGLPPTFTCPPEDTGLVAMEDPEWHQWACENVKALLRIRDLNYSTCNVLTFIG
jgi:hypothetical protein